MDYDGLLKQYTRSYPLTQVKTTSMGTLYELDYLITPPQDTVPKTFLDALGCRSGSLNITCGRVAVKDAL